MRRTPRAPDWLTRATAVLAALLLPLGLLSSWVAAVVTDTDRYVSTVRPLAYDEGLRDAVAVRLERVAVDAIDFDRQRDRLAALLDDRGVNRLLQRGAFALADLARTSSESVVHRIVTRVVHGDEFPDAWEAANRSAHEELVAVLSGDEDAVVTDGSIDLQLAVLLNAVIAVLETEGLLQAGAVDPLDASFTLVEAEDLDRAQQAYRLLDALGFWLPAVWLVLLVLTLVLASSRRSALGWLAWGSLAGLLLLSVALALLREHLVGAVPGAEDQQLVRSVVTIVLGDLRATLVAAVVACVLVLAVRWLSGPTPPATRLRGAGGAALSAVRSRDTAEVVRGTGAVVLVALALWWLL